MTGPAFPLPAVTKDSASSGVHLVVCRTATDVLAHEDAFLAAVAQARGLVARGARRIIFLVPVCPGHTALRTSLGSFCAHAARAIRSSPVTFGIVHLDGHEPSAGRHRLPAGWRNPAPIPN